MQEDIPSSVKEARTNPKVWDAIGDYAGSETMSIPALHKTLEDISGNVIQQDLPYWNSIIDQLGEGDALANYAALRKEHVVADIVNAVCSSSVSHS